MCSTRIPPPPLYEDVLEVVTQSDTEYLNDQYTDFGLNKLLHEFAPEIVFDILKPSSKDTIQMMNDLHRAEYTTETGWLCGPQQQHAFNEPVFTRNADGYFDSYQTKENESLPPVPAHYIEDVTLYGPFATPVTRNDEYLLPCANGQYRYLASLVASTVIDYTKHQEQYSDPEQYGTVLPLLGFGELNYYHWVAEFLPRLRAAYYHYDVTGKFPTLLINDGLYDPFIHESLDALGVSEFTEVWDQKTAHVDNLIVTHGMNSTPQVNYLGVKPRGFPFQRRNMQTQTQTESCP